MPPDTDDTDRDHDIDTDDLGMDRSEYGERAVSFVSVLTEQLDGLTIMGHTDGTLTIELPAAAAGDVLQLAVGYDMQLVGVDPGDTWLLTFYPDPRMSDIYGYPIRKHGGSARLTLPPPAMQRAGFDIGDEPGVYAREGQILLTDDQHPYAAAHRPEIDADELPGGDAHGE